MPDIFVNTDNSSPNNKLYNASMAGKSAGAAEAKMQAVVKKIIGKTAGFTTTKFDNAKGYSLRLKISKLDVANNKTSCSLSGEILRYPATATLKGAKGEEMVSTNWTGSATADGTSEGSLLDCVEAITESMVPKSVPIMRADMGKR